MTIPFEYTCTLCGRTFLNQTKLARTISPRCEPCRIEVKKAAARKTWHDHKDKYRVQKKEPKVKKPVPEVVAAEPVRTNVTDRLLPDGKRVVWEFHG